MQSDTPRTDDEFSDAIKQLDLRAELAEMKKQLAEARGLYLQRNYHREQLERELAAAKDELVSKADELAAAIKQRDEAQRDAQRYRWLKSKGCDWVTIYRHGSGDEIFDGKGDAKMDERIDAARTRDEEGGGA